MDASVEHGGLAAWHDPALRRRAQQEVSPAAAGDGVDLLSRDASVEHGGLAAGHDPALWHRAKQEVSPAAAGVQATALRLGAATSMASPPCLPPSPSSRRFYK